MTGARPLTREECIKVRDAFTGRYAYRNRTLFLLGINTGFRISELLSLRIADVVEHDGSVTDRITVQRKFMKGGKRSRSVVLNTRIKVSLLDYLQNDMHLNIDWENTNTHPLFPSEREYGMSISRIQADRILKDAFREAGLRGNLSTHTMRKTFANNFFTAAEKLRKGGENIDPFRLTSKALGHAVLDNTDKYLSFMESDIDNTIEEIGI